MRSWLPREEREESMSFSLLMTQQCQHGFSSLPKGGEYRVAREYGSLLMMHNRLLAHQPTWPLSVADSEVCREGQRSITLGCLGISSVWGGEAVMQESTPPWPQCWETWKLLEEMDSRKLKSNT